MRLHISVFLVFLGLLAGCSPSYEAEYLAALKELEQVKQQLAEAQQRLNAADYETRSKIYSLARRANSYLEANSLDTETLNRLHHEMILLNESYRQLSGTEDMTALTAQFYTTKMAQVLNLHQAALQTYDRQYNDCLSELNSQGGKSDLTSMLCEVQADSAALKSHQQHQAHLSALTLVGKQLLLARQQQSQLTAAQIQQRYNQQLENWLSNPPQ